MSDTFIINYFLLCTNNLSRTSTISNYFYKYSSLPLDKLLPYPNRCSKSYLDWIKSYWGVTINPTLYSIQTNSNSVLVALYISDKYIINHFYSTLWLDILYHYFFLSSSSIILTTSTTTCLPSFLPISSLNTHLIR